MSELAVTEARTLPGVRHATRFLVNSFRFSRGNSDLQKEIFEFTALHYRGDFDVRDVSAAIPQVIHIAGQYTHHRGIHPSLIYSREAVVEAVETEAGSFGACLLQEVEELEEAFEPAYLVASVLNSDDNYIPHHKEHEDWIGPYSPSYKSNMVTHGLLGRRTGQPEIDHFFAYATQQMWQELFGHDDDWSQKARGSLSTVVAAHLAYNPGDAEPLAAVCRPNS